jgi:hypothetical protein
MGQATVGKLIPFTVPLTSVEVIPQDRHRRSLILCPPDVGVITYTTDPTAVAGLGFNMTPNQEPLILMRDWIGSIVGQTWYAISVGGPSNAAYIYSAFQGQLDQVQQ